MVVLDQNTLPKYPPICQNLSWGFLYYKLHKRCMHYICLGADEVKIVSNPFIIIKGLP